LVRNIDQGCVGGAFFEYSDEQEKGDTAERTMGVVNLAVAGPPGQSSMDPNVFLVDTATKKEFIYYAMMDGSLNGTKVNYNSDVWQLMGRQRTSLGPNECVPPPRPSTTGAPLTIGGTTTATGSPGTSSSGVTGQGTNSSQGSTATTASSQTTSVQGSTNSGVTTMENDPAKNFEESSASSLGPIFMLFVLSAILL
jgi:hypothetical protein